MGQFNSMKLTVKGNILFNKAQTGTQLQFTKVAIGDGILSEGQTLESLTELINKTKDLNINNSNINDDGTAEIITALSNQGLAEGMYIREIGLYANDPDDGEILYSVANASDKADYLPPEGTDVIEELIKIVTIIGNTENIDVIINESMVYVTQTSFNEFKTQVNASMADIAHVIVATGTGTVITLSMPSATAYTANMKLTFIASADNSGGATTIQINSLGTKNLYKPNTTTAPNLKSGKPYTVWYDGTNFFLQASAEGDALAGDVLAGKTFSTGEDVGIVGTMDLSNLIPNNVREGIAINGVVGIVKEKRQVSGSAVSKYFTSGSYGIEVTGLTFKPTRIDIYIGINETSNLVHQRSIYDANLSTQYYTALVNTGNGVYEVNYNGGYINTGGFKMIISGGIGAGTTFNWVAYE